MGIFLFIFAQIDKAYFAEANAVITVPPISDKDMEENRVTVTLGGKAVRVSGNDLRLAEERPQVEEEEVLLSCPVCGASPDSLMLELVAEGEQYAPDQLTHERPDSWERLEEDARQLDIDLNDTTDEYPRMSCCRDLVRRARALAEGSE